MKGGTFHITVKDKQGRVKDSYPIKNDVTDYGKELMLTNALTGTWYIGLIRTFNDPDPALQIPPFPAVVLNALGWMEYTAYTGDRKAWTPVIVGGNATGNTVQFSGFNEAMCPMRGIFLAKTASKGGGYDTIFSQASGGNVVTLDDIVEATYEINI